MARHSALQKTRRVTLKYWSDKDQYLVTSVTNSVSLNPGDWLYRKDVESLIEERYLEVTIT